MRTSFLVLSALVAVAAGVWSVEDLGKAPALGEDATLPERGASGAAAVAKGGRAEPAGTLPVRLTTDAAAEPAAGQQSPATNAPAEAPAVDESALRYFAQQGDLVRLQAEIARLRALYPGWEPPKDPLAAARGGDPRVDALWKLYAQSRYDEVDKAMAERQKAEPGWKPPQELVDSLRLARLRQNIVKASNDGAYQSVIDLAAQAPQLLTCAEVDMLWRIGEAFAKTDRQARATQAFSYVLQNCANPQERLATVQKALPLLTPVDMEALLKLEQTGADGKPEFDGIRDDIARGFVAQGGANASVAVSKTYVDRLEEIARRDGKASDDLLLGWYFYRRSEIQAADEWFRRSYDKQPVAAAAQGLALTRIALGDPAAAEDTLYRFHDANDETRAVYLAAVANLLALDPPKAVDNSVLARMAPVVIAARNTAAAEQFGWYALMLQQTRTAADWFRLVLSWDKSYEPAAYGLAVALHALGDEAGVSRIQTEWAGRSERIASLRDRRHTGRATPAVAAAQPARIEEPSPPRPQPAPQTDAVYDRPVAAIPRSAAPQAVVRQARVSGCRTSMDPAALSPAQALARGWCLMEMKRPVEAVDAFSRAMQGGDPTTRQDAAYGKSLAYLRLKLTGEAAVAATAVPQTPARAAELQTAIITDRALDAYRQARYTETIILLDQRRRLAPERQDLMMLRASAYYKLGHMAEAQRIYRALAAAGNKAALQALGDIRDGGAG